MLKRVIYLALGAVLLTTGTGCYPLWAVTHPFAYLHGYGDPHSYRTWYGCDGVDECNNCDGYNNRARGVGCGKVYWSEWYNDPPYCNDPCDCRGDHACKSKYWGSPREFAGGEVIHEGTSLLSRAEPPTATPKIARHRTPTKKSPVRAASYFQRRTPYR